jgi:hypothetical protein
MGILNRLRNYGHSKIWLAGIAVVLPSRILMAIPTKQISGRQDFLVSIERALKRLLGPESVTTWSTSRIVFSATALFSFLIICIWLLSRLFTRSNGFNNIYDGRGATHTQLSKAGASRVYSGPAESPLIAKRDAAVSAVLESSSEPLEVQPQNFQLRADASLLARLEAQLLRHPKLAFDAFFDLLGTAHSATDLSIQLGGLKSFLMTRLPKDLAVALEKRFAWEAGGRGQLASSDYSLGVSALLLRIDAATSGLGLMSFEDRVLLSQMPDKIILDAIRGGLGLRLGAVLLLLLPPTRTIHLLGCIEPGLARKLIQTVARDSVKATTHDAAEAMEHLRPSLPVRTSPLAQGDLESACGDLLAGLPATLRICMTEGLRQSEWGMKVIGKKLMPESHAVSYTKPLTSGQDKNF